MQLNTLSPSTPRKAPKRVGRGGARGKTSGRGTKGQNARAGTSKRPEMRDIIKKLPKLRGHGKNRGRTVNADKQKAQVVNLSTLEASFEHGDRVTPSALLKKGEVRRFHGRTPAVKVLGDGELTKKLTLVNLTLSKGAREAVEKAGGEIQ